MTEPKFHIIEADTIDEAMEKIAQMLSEETALEDKLAQAMPHLSADHADPREYRYKPNQCTAIQFQGPINFPEFLNYLYEAHIPFFFCGKHEHLHVLVPGSKTQHLVEIKDWLVVEGTYGSDDFRFYISEDAEFHNAMEPVPSVQDCSKNGLFDPDQRPQETWTSGDTVISGAQPFSGLADDNVGHVSSD